MPHRIRASALLLIASAAAWGAGGGVRIVPSGEGFRLTRNGQPFAIRGGCGRLYLERLAAAGGNSVRAGVESLDRAAALGLTVLVDVPLGTARTGFDYSDPRQTARQREQVLRLVAQYKNHPALLMWSLGDEPEGGAAPDRRPAMWAEINRLAGLVHQADGRHPVLTALGPGYKRMLPEIHRQCPDLDAVGVNASIDILTLADDIAISGWTRPWVVTALGPRGHSQAAHTSWRAPIEDSSTEKADFYLNGWRRAVEGRPHCLGAYAYLWAHGYTATPTWYAMFLEDGSATGAVDVMTWLWTGRWPANRCPRIGPGRIRVQQVGATDTGSRIYPPGARLLCEVEASDPDADPLAYGWEIRPDLGVESGAAVLPVLAQPSPGNRTILRLPAQPGRYRVFVYVRDGKGSAATANFPVLVEAARQTAVLEVGEASRR